MAKPKIPVAQNLPLVNDMQTNSQGFTLIEVLVALLVLSIGLLGIAGMQLFSLKSNQDSGLRIQAVYIAYSLIDKMRANQAQALAGTYNIALGTGPSGGQNCYTSNCDVTQLAAFELNLWKCELGKYASGPVCATTLNVTPALPQGDGSVTLNGNQVTVRVEWQDSTKRTDLSAPLKHCKSWRNSN